MQALWMLLGAAFFATMGVCVKFGSQHFNSAELVFYRGIVGVVFLAIIAKQNKVSLRTQYPSMHLWRSAIGVFSLSAWFYAIAKLPLATAMTLNYMSSVWIAAFLVGGTLINWTPQEGRSPWSQGPLALSVIAGFAGVVMMLRPTIEQNQIFAGLIGLMSGFAAAFAYMQVMALGRLGEPETRTVFYFAIGTTIAAFVPPAMLRWLLYLAAQASPYGYPEPIAKVVEKAIDAAREAGHSLVLLVGDEDYYARVGFVRVPHGRVVMPGPVDPDRLLYCELQRGGFEKVHGKMRRL